MDATTEKKIQDLLATEAVQFHMKEPKGKISIKLNKDISTQADLSNAYSPGAANACELISIDKKYTDTLTNKHNLIAVVTNGSALLGLGNRGPWAAKPVMEGKCALFKKLADIDAFDININEQDPEKIAHIIKALEPTFGGINIEDIKAPDCFTVESMAKEMCNIPVMHDDQHCTAIVICAGIINSLILVNKNIENCKIVICGAGAAGVATANLLLKIKAKQENIWALDAKGVIYHGREQTCNRWQEPFARPTSEDKTLSDAVKDADIFIGLSVGNVLSAEDILTMSANPLIFALANPTPEIAYNTVQATRSDAIYASGRSDHKNQINNIIGFPFLFRGSLDAFASTINEEMKIACVERLAYIARQGIPEYLQEYCQQENTTFNKEYIIPNFLDPRLKIEIPYATYIAAMKSGVAASTMKPGEYRDHLEEKFHLVGKSKYSIMGKKMDMNVIFAGFRESQTANICMYMSKVCNPVFVSDQEIISNFNVNKFKFVIIREENALYKNTDKNEPGDLLKAHLVINKRRFTVLIACAKELKDDEVYFNHMIEFIKKIVSLFHGIKLDMQLSVHNTAHTHAKKMHDALEGLDISVCNDENMQYDKPTIFIADHHTVQSMICCLKQYDNTCNEFQLGFTNDGKACLYVKPGTHIESVKSLTTVMS